MQPIDIIGELYSPLLAALHVKQGEDGILKRVHGDNVKICEVNKRKLVLPTNQNLQSLSAEDYIFFHPMSENFARGDSVMFNYLKTLITLRVNYSLIGLATVLLQIAGDKQLDGKFNSTQLELLTHIPKVDKKTVDNWLAAAVNLDIDTNTFFSVYNRRNGKINGTTYNRVAVVRFPLIEQLREVSESTYWSTPKAIRKADWVNYLALLSYILPDWNVENRYSGYSDSMEAPSFHALIMAFVTIMERITKVANDFSDKIDAQDLIVADLDKLKAAVNNLQRFANIIPPLDGNIGEVAKKETQANQIQGNPIGVPPTGLLNSADNKLNSYNNQPTYQQPQQTPPAQQPQGYQQPQQPPAPQQPQGFIGFPQPQPYGYQPQQYPPQGYPQPGYPQPQAPGGFITYPNQQQPYGYPPAQPQQTVNPNDPMASWHSAIQPQPPQYPPQYVNPYPQPGYPAPYPPQGYPQQQVQPGFPQPQPYGYPPQAQQYPPQGYPQPGYPQPQQFFRKMGEAHNDTTQQLPPTFKASQ